jgi:hypothetical protein
MNTFFRALFEWWSQINFYGTDMKQFLSGYDTLTGDYTASARYIIVGFSMLAIVATCFVSYYFLIDSIRLRKRQHWFLFLLACMLINFTVAFVTSTAGVRASLDQGVIITYMDCFGFALSVTLWSMLIFLILSISPFPRKLSTNCKFTPWKN